MSLIHPTIKGRGAADNPPNRFEPIEFEPDWENLQPSEIPSPQTQYLRDTSRTIIARNNSPDVGFEFSINPYRGCEHGCIYCYARPTHEYFGLSAGLDFETKIFVKLDAPQLLRAELSRAKWQPTMIALSGVTDCYQPIERKLQLTRECLKVLAEFRNPCGIVTKNHLLTRDIDVLRKLAEYHCISVMVSITTLDHDLASKMEPRTSAPRRRLEAIRALSDAGIPVGVMVAPIIPGLTDHEIPTILREAASAGAQYCGYVMLRLPFAVAPLFEQWLERHYPQRSRKVLSHIRSVRSGRINDPNFYTRMRGEGPVADQIHKMFQIARRRCGLQRPMKPFSTAEFRRPGQLSLLESPRDDPASNLK